MEASSGPHVGPVDVMLDLRQLTVEMRSQREFRRIWGDIARDLIGKPATPGRWMELSGPKGAWRVLVVDSRGVPFISSETRVNVVDIGRNPETRHACEDCARLGRRVFGPFYCPECRERKLGDRLCETHAHFLENKYAAYCLEHLPRCRCREDCPDPAAFECDRCHRPFSERLRRPHPNDPTRLFCDNCYSYQFELCPDCQRVGERRLGKSRCGFPSGAGDERHAHRLCTIKHAWQWQVWGPHWRGVTLCEEHYRRLGSAEPGELLWMLVAAKAPAPFLRDKARDVYRLKNIVGYVRRREFTWPEMDAALRALARRAEHPAVPRHARENVEHLLKDLAKVDRELPAIEARLLAQVRAFYRPHLRTDPADAVLAVTVKRVFGRGGAGQSYRIAIRVGRDSHGSFKPVLIGRGGLLVNQLKDALGLRGVDFEE